MATELLQHMDWPHFKQPVAQGLSHDLHELPEFGRELRALFASPDLKHLILSRDLAFYWHNCLGKLLVCLEDPVLAGLLKAVWISLKMCQPTVVRVYEIDEDIRSFMEETLGELLPRESTITPSAHSLALDHNEPLQLFEILLRRSTERAATVADASPSDPS
ncbi:hypothetical protein TRAPUB_1164 [Trametes pubescens]|uniref:Uncharacterized protein n=1 Tax=Trametes pubescens TaxID=154538 RepID=A0A1M2VK97_TRAPU|nr:hypothetical protein TRAPUB_1164 [Trametes pubescens]